MKIEHLHHLFLASKGITTDSRNIYPDQIFFALRGENFNGNTFAHKALEQGAGNVVIDEAEYAKRGDQYILVQDVLKTLQELATYHRMYLKIPVLAITGSNGKTTSKELINAVLGRKFKTVATVGNLNNHIGVPLTLLSFNESTNFGIVEMGANHPGEIELLSNIALPDYGYITNFGKAHLEGFGSIEGVIIAKSELYTNLTERNKFIFINADDPVQRKLLSYDPVFSFGESEDANLKVTYSANSEKAEVTTEGTTYNSLLTGSYNSVNIAAAICIGKYFEVADDQIKEAISTYSPKNNRSQVLKRGETTLLLDAYNANPTSMKAALESFSNYPAPKKSVILGDMFELGKDAEIEHQEIVTYLESSGFENIYLTGSNFFKTKSSAENIEFFRNFEELEKKVKTSNFNNQHILIKGSRGMALERIVEVFEKQVNL